MSTYVNSQAFSPRGTVIAFLVEPSVAYNVLAEIKEIVEFEEELAGSVRNEGKMIMAE